MDATVASIQPIYIALDKSDKPPVLLGFTGLAALTFGMMVGAGIFNIPQNMAVGAGAGAVILSWLITAAGMLLLVFTFKKLTELRPELDAGIYQYSAEGFGPFLGFNMAWGYWLCTAFANVAYAVMLNDTVGAFFPELLNHGWATMIFGITLIWLYYFIVASGMKTAKVLTVVLSVVKIAAILLIIALLGLNFHCDTFSSGDFSDASGLIDQVKSTMLVTLWCFIGIEGASMMSGRAKRSADVGRATVAGFFAAWILYLLVSVLCYGVMSRTRLAGLEDPSVAYCLREVIGPWAYWLVIFAVIISLGGGWVAWTLVCAEVPYSAARVKIFPRSFLRLNRHQMPAYGLAISSVVMTLFLLLVMTADDVYLSALNITGMMILPCYLFCGLFLFKSDRRPWTRFIGGGCAIFCGWMIYSGGLDLFIQTSLFYLPGLAFYIPARRQQGAKLFTRKEQIGLCLLILAGIYSLLL